MNILKTSNPLVEFYYALGLHMHQPPGNLKLLIESNEWEARQIICCYERAVRFAEQYPEIDFHVGFSGILLEQFLDPAIIDRYRPFVDIPKMLARYKAAKNIEVIGMGFYHPIFPLIPREDWPDQLAQGRAIVEHIFGQKPKGFWPSEMAFTMAMIPDLRAAGYEYVVVDHVHVRPEDSNKPCDPFRPYRAVYDGAAITIIPRNRDISNAQESGMNPSWFLGDTALKLAAAPAGFPARLVTTWSDGENGGWFRQMDDNAGFWGYFFAPLAEMIRQKSAPVKFISMSQFLKKFPPQEEASVQTGAWNVGSTSGHDFRQWNGSETQKRAIDAVFAVSRRYWDFAQQQLPREKQGRLTAARRQLLDAETSCYLFWGEAWLPKVYEKLDAASRLLDTI